MLPNRAHRPRIPAGQRHPPLRAPARRRPFAHGPRNSRICTATTFGTSGIRSLSCPALNFISLAASRLAPAPPGRNDPQEGGGRLRLRRGVGPWAQAQARNVPRENRSRSAWGDAAPVVRGAGVRAFAAWRRPSRAAFGRGVAGAIRARAGIAGRGAGAALRGMAKAQPRRLWARRSRSHSRSSRNCSWAAGARALPPLPAQAARNAAQSAEWRAGCGGRDGLASGVSRGWSAQRTLGARRRGRGGAVPARRAGVKRATLAAPGGFPSAIGAAGP